MDELIQEYLAALVEDETMRGNLTDAECERFVKAMTLHIKSKLQLALTETRAELRTINQMCQPGDGWLERQAVIDAMLGIGK